MFLSVFIENDLATRNVLDIIAKKINKYWRALSCELGVNVSIWKRLLFFNKSPEECLHQSFKELEHTIIWKSLKEKLIKIGQEDIVILVEKEDLITVGKKKVFFLQVTLLKSLPTFNLDLARNP